MSTISAHFKDVLPFYFSRLFPFDELYRWLSYGEEDTFACREFAFNFDGVRFLRNQSYSNVGYLKSKVKSLRPVKFDIGAVYNVMPSNNTTKNCYPVQRELTFDIDITDYDEVRTCCSGGDICIKCWNFMTIAIKILDVALREDFGFNHILWVFSGRRGVHCWVCNRKARFLRPYDRSAVANYLQLITGGDYKKKKVRIGCKMHYIFKRAINIIEPLFKKVCVEEQNMLGTEERVFRFLGIIDEDEMRKEVRTILDQYSTSLSKWQAFVTFFKSQIKAKSEKWCKSPYLIEEIMIQYAYPRLDIQVSIGMKHLLKSPFCVHPQTGKIGVLIDPVSVDQFDPNSVPNIIQLLDEIEDFDTKRMNQGMSVDELRKIKCLEKTSLSSSLSILNKFLHNLENDNKEKIKENT